MRKIYLSTLAIIMTVVGVVYLVDPSSYLGRMGVSVSDPSAMNLLRTFGGCYLGFAAFLLVAVRRSRLSEAAILAATIIMGGFLTGRIIGMAADGMPDGSIIVSAFVELIFLVWGGVVTRRGTNAGSYT
jgi:hypothetical protein